MKKGRTFYYGVVKEGEDCHRTLTSEPGRHNSGETNKNGEMIFRGQSKLKTTIIESAWTSARRVPALFLVINH